MGLLHLACSSIALRLLAPGTGITRNRRVQERNSSNETELRSCLTELGVAGDAQSLLVMERIGYPVLW